MPFSFSIPLATFEAYVNDWLWPDVGDIADSYHDGIFFN